MRFADRRSHSVRFYTYLRCRLGGSEGLSRPWHVRVRYGCVASVKVGQRQRVVVTGVSGVACAHVACGARPARPFAQTLLHRIMNSYRDVQSYATFTLQ
jgi:hypothetical protein